MQKIKEIIEAAYEQRTQLTPQNVPVALRDAIHTTIDMLDKGHLRIAEKKTNQWHIIEWAKKAVLLYFRTEESKVMAGNYTQFFDKVPLKYRDHTQHDFNEGGVRIVPCALARKGAYIGPNTVLMPSYINIGAYIGEGTMIDTWATIGSCAQIGKHVHISGGVGIGGVLEPLQAKPTIIEDDCFIGARSEIVEGVIIEAGSVISMGVYIGQSTRIYNRETDEVIYGRVPAGSVVVPGNLPSKEGKYSLYCAVIVKRVDKKTREKIGLNKLLRSVTHHD